MRTETEGDPRSGEDSQSPRPLKRLVRRLWNVCKVFGPLWILPSGALWCYLFAWSFDHHIAWLWISLLLVLGVLTVAAVGMATAMVPILAIVIYCAVRDAWRDA